MTERNSDPDHPFAHDPVRKESDTAAYERHPIETEPGATERPVDDRGGFRDTAPNPHDEGGSAKTAAETTGAAAGMFLPAIIIAIVAIVIILYFVLR
jgi:hypothetical protein